MIYTAIESNLKKKSPNSHTSNSQHMSQITQVPQTYGPFYRHGNLSLLQQRYLTAFDDFIELTDGLIAQYALDHQSKIPYDNMNDQNNVTTLCLTNTDASTSNNITISSDDCDKSQNDEVITGFQGTIPPTQNYKLHPNNPIQFNYTRPINPPHNLAGGSVFKFNFSSGNDHEMKKKSEGMDEKDGNLDNIQVFEQNRHTIFSPSCENSQILIAIYRDRANHKVLINHLLLMIHYYSEYLVLFNDHYVQSVRPALQFERRLPQRDKNQCGYHYFYIIWIHLHALFEAFPKELQGIGSIKNGEGISSYHFTHHHAFMQTVLHLTTCHEDKITPYMSPDSGIATPDNETIDIFHDMVYYAKSTKREEILAKIKSEEKIEPSQLDEENQLLNPPTVEKIITFPREYNLDHNFDIFSHPTASKSTLETDNNNNNNNNNTDTTKVLLPYKDPVPNYAAIASISVKDPEFNFLPNTFSTCYSLSHEFDIIPVQNHHKLAICLESLIDLLVCYLKRQPSLDQTVEGMLQLTHIATILMITPNMTSISGEFGMKLVKNILKEINTRLNRKRDPEPCPLSAIASYLASKEMNYIFVKYALATMQYPLRVSLESSLSGMVTTTWGGVLSPLKSYLHQSLVFILVHLPHDHNHQRVDLGISIRSGDMRYNAKECEVAFDIEFLLKSIGMVTTLAQYNQWCGFRQKKDLRYNNTYLNEYGLVATKSRGLELEYKQFVQECQKDQGSQQNQGSKIQSHLPNDPMNNTLHNNHNNAKNIQIIDQFVSKVCNPLNIEDNDDVIRYNDHQPFFNKLCPSNHVVNNPIDDEQYVPKCMFLNEDIFSRIPTEARSVLLNRLYDKISNDYPEFFNQYRLLLLSTFNHYKQPYGDYQQFVSIMHFDKKTMIGDGPTGLHIMGLWFEWLMGSRNAYNPAMKNVVPKTHSPLSPHPARYRITPLVHSDLFNRITELATQLKQQRKEAGNNQINIFSNFLLHLVYYISGQFFSRRLAYRSIYKNDSKPSKLQFSNVAHYDLYIHPSLTPLYRDTSLNLLPYVSEFVPLSRSNIPPSKANPRLFENCHDPMVLNTLQFIDTLNHDTPLHFFNSFLYQNMGEIIYMAIASHNFIRDGPHYRVSEQTKNIIKSILNIFDFFQLSIQRIVQESLAPQSVIKVLNALYVDTLLYVIRGFSYLAFETSRYNTISSMFQRVLPHDLDLEMTGPTINQLGSVYPKIVEKIKMNIDKEKEMKKKSSDEKPTKLKNTTIVDRVSVIDSYDYHSKRNFCEAHILYRQAPPSSASFGSLSTTTTTTTSTLANAIRDDHSQGIEPKTIEPTIELSSAMVQITIELFIDLLLNQDIYNDCIKSLDFSTPKPLPNYITPHRQNDSSVIPFNITSCDGRGVDEINPYDYRVPSLNDLVRVDPCTKKTKVNNTNNNNEQEIDYLITQEKLPHYPPTDPNGLSVFSQFNNKKKLDEASILIPATPLHNGFFHALDRQDLETAFKTLSLEYKIANAINKLKKGGDCAISDNNTNKHTAQEQDEEDNYDEDDDKDRNKHLTSTINSTQFLDIIDTSSFRKAITLAQHNNDMFDIKPHRIIDNLNRWVKEVLEKVPHFDVWMKNKFNVELDGVNNLSVTTNNRINTTLHGVKSTNGCSIAEEHFTTFYPKEHYYLKKDDKNDLLSQNNNSNNNPITFPTYMINTPQRYKVQRLSGALNWLKGSHDFLTEFSNFENEEAEEPLE